MGRKKRKKRPNPYKEGSLNKIAKLFIRPLYRFCPEGTPIKDWLEDIFHVKTREIVRYRVTRKFLILGAYLIAPTKPIYGTGPRKVNEGAELFVRIDHTSPNEIAVEVYNGKGSKEKVFILNQEEWKHTQQFIVPLDQVNV